MTSHYDRSQMPLSALRLLDQIFPENRFIDLEDEEEEKKEDDDNLTKYEGGEGEKDQNENYQAKEDEKEPDPQSVISQEPARRQRDILS